MSRIFVTGDLHGHVDFEKMINFSLDEGKTLTKDDYVIICGDFGLIFDYKGMNSTEERLLNMLDSMPWTTLFVDGNHECFPRLAAYDIEEWQGGKIHRIMPSIIHLMRGEVFNIANRTLLAFGGAQSIDRYRRTPGQTWWSEEEASEKDFNNAMKNLEKVNFKPDIIITHEMPMDYKREFFGGKVYNNDKTAQILNSILYFCPNYRKWYCGHYHINLSLKENFRILYNKVEEII